MKADRLLKILMDMKSFPRALRNQKVLAKFRAGLNRELNETEHDMQSIILSEGQIADRAYVVLKGLVRAFLIDPKTGEEIGLFFFKEGMIAIAAPSFFLQQPSRVYLEVMPGTILQSTAYPQAQKLFKRFPQAQAFIQAVLLDYHETLVGKLVSRQTRSAAERYAQLLDEFPDIRKQVSQKVIASHIGVTRPTLNKIMKAYNG